MDYKAIRLIGFISLMVSFFCVAVWCWYRFGSGSSTESLAIVQLTSFVFLVVGTLAGRVGSVLERQSDEIAALRRLLAEKSGAKVEL